ncbi:hypothetical protein Syun_002585 [Stephania yunnanensis]|uniref:BZIP domain-containing protein n=1 Tax=Stephania yunnanensis TaxID=152371 RepID=A0AAP0LIX7_9MAGN
MGGGGSEWGVGVLRGKGNPRIDLERCSVSCSVSSSSSSASAEAKRGTDLMVKIELDAARALADFAQLALLERGKFGGSRVGSGGGSGGGRRSGRRANWMGRNVLLLRALRARSSSIGQECSIEDGRQPKANLKNAGLEAVKNEESESSRPTHTYCRSYMSHGGKSKQSLTEIEKEARRVRRVLANRESARQTIRRRQPLCHMYSGAVLLERQERNADISYAAMCEELTRKAADLAWDNESLKRMACRIKSEIEEGPAEVPSLMPPKPHCDQVAPPKFPCEQPPSQFEQLQPFPLCPRPTVRPPFWPSIFRHVNPVFTNSIPPNVSAVQDPTSIACKLNFVDESDSPLSTNVKRIPCYILPCPWFFPLSDCGNASHSQVVDSSNSKNKRSEVSTTKQPEQLLLKGDDVAESNSTDNLPEVSSKYSTSEDSNFSNYPNMANLLPTSLGTVWPSFSHNFEEKLQQVPTFKEESTADHAGNAYSEGIGGSNFKSSNKLVDVSAAAEARKRRKELTKMKNLHRRQFRSSNRMKY